MNKHLLKCMSFQLTVYLKTIIGLFSQSDNLERPGSDVSIRFFWGVVGQRLGGPEGTEM